MSDVAATLARLDDQISWYDRKSGQSQTRFKALKLVTIVSAALIPVVSQFVENNAYVSILGVIVIIVESVQQLNQYEQLWITYRATAEALKHEKYLHAAKAGPYGEAPDPEKLLAERIEELVSQESKRWVESNLSKSDKAAQR
jgi:hypothetical protein